MSLDSVYVDINMRQNVDEESKSAVESIRKLMSASKNAREELLESIRVQEVAIGRIKKELEPLEQQFKKINIGTNDPSIIAERKKLSEAVRELRSELHGEEKILGELKKKYEKIKDNQVTLITLMRNVKNEMAQLKIEGKGETEMYRKKEEQLRLLALAHKELTKEQQLLASGGSNLQGFLSGLSALSGLLSAGGGALGLLNANSKEYAEIQTKVQALMAITIGLQQVQNALHQTSAFRVKTVAGAKRIWAQTTTQLAVALGISNTAAKVLMGTLSLGLSVAVGAGIALMDKYVSRQRATAEEQQKFSDAMAQNGAKQMGTYEQMRVSYNKLGEDVKAKTQFVRDNQDAFKELGIAINGVNDADNVFIHNTEQFKQAIEQRALAAAALEMATENYKKMLVERQKRKEKEEKKRLRGEQWSENAKAAAELRDPNAPMPSDNTAGTWQIHLKPQLTKIPYADTKKEVAEHLSEKELEYKTAAEEWMQQYVGATGIVDNIFKTYGFRRPNSKATNPGADVKNARLAAEKKIAALTIDVQKEIDAATVAAMQEGRDQKLAELKADYDARVAVIKQRTREIYELEKKTGVDGSEVKKLLASQETVEKEKYDAKVKAVNDGSSEALAEVLRDIDTRFGTETQRRLGEIDRFYAEQTDKARKNGATQMELDKISENHKRDRELEKQHIALETLEFDEQIAIRRAQIENRQVTLQAEREEKILRIQLHARKKRLDKLKEIEAAGGDVGEEITKVTTEINELNYALGRMPVNKLREIAGHLKSMLDDVGSAVGGDWGDSLSALADGVDSVMSSFDKDSTSYEKIGAAVNNLAKLYEIAARQTEENKQKQEEWNAVIEEAVHRSRLLRIEAHAYQEANAFGIENPYARAIAGAHQYAAAMKELHDSMNKLASGSVQTGTKKVVSGKNVVGGLAAGAGAGAAVGSFFGPVGTAVGAAIGGLVGTIVGVTQKKVVPVFQSITQQFGSILKEGTKTFELNPKILENYAKLDAQTKKLVDNWEEIKKKALDAEKQMTETFANLAGDLGNALSSSLVDAFRSGDVYNAIDNFRDKVSETIESIVEKMIFAAHFQHYFDELQVRMKKSFKAGGDETIVDDIIWFSRVYKEGIEAYGKSMEEAKKTLEEQGFKLFLQKNEGRREAANKGIAQASQDSIDELNGRLTFLVMKVSDIGAINTANVDLGKEQLLVQRAMLGRLEIIAENSEFLRNLKKIDENIDRLAREGFYIKK